VPRLSIILPVLGNPVEMEDSLVSVLENRPPDCEVLVVLNQPYADPYDLRSEVCFIEAPRGTRWIDSINLGIAVSRAPIVHLITCGVTANEGWCDAALDHFHDPAVAAVTPWIIDRENPRRVVAAGASYHPSGRVRRLRPRRPQPLPAPSDALVDPDLPVAFYRKTALDLVGRFSARMGDRLAAVDLGMTLRQQGLRCLVEPRCQMHAGRQQRAVTEAALLRGWAAERLFWRWLPSGRLLSSVPLHALVLAGEMVQTLIRPSNVAVLAGRVAGGLAAQMRPWPSLPVPAEPSSKTPAVQPPHFQRINGRPADQRARSLEESQSSF